MGNACMAAIILSRGVMALPEISIKSAEELSALKADIIRWGKALGFQDLGVSDIDLRKAEARLEQWLDSGNHGEMDYMHQHGKKRSRP